MLDSEGWDRLLDCLFETDVNDLNLFVSYAPVVLAGESEAKLRDRAKRRPDAQRQAALDLIDGIERFRTEIESGEMPYVVGGGPLEVLMFKVDRGEMDFKAAVAQAREPDLLDRISWDYLCHVTKVAVDESHKGRWRQALGLQRLASAAAEALLTEVADAKQIRPWIDMNLIEVAKQSMCEVHDGLLFWEVVAMGEQLVAESDNPKIRRGALHRLGALHLDAYVVGVPDLTMLEHTIWERVQRFKDAAGPALWTLDESEWRLPPVEEALQKAATYFRRATDLSVGPDRGLSLKGLFQALVCLQELGHEIAREEAVWAGREALEYLDPEEREPRLFVTNALAALFGVPVNKTPTNV